MYPAAEEQGLIGNVHGRAGCRRRHDRLVLRAAVRLASIFASLWTRRRVARNDGRLTNSIR
jgi:hypothetical protein